MENQTKIAVRIDSLEFRNILLNTLKENGWDTRVARYADVGRYVSIPGLHSGSREASYSTKADIYLDRGYEILTEKDWDRIEEVITGTKKETTYAKISVPVMKEFSIRIPVWAESIEVFGNGDVYAYGKNGSPNHSEQIFHIHGIADNNTKYKVNRGVTLTPIKNG